MTSRLIQKHITRVDLIIDVVQLESLFKPLCSQVIKITFISYFDPRFANFIANLIMQALQTDVNCATD